MRRFLSWFPLLVLVALSACRSGGDAPRVLFIGIDGLSWDALNAMIKAGEAPNFARVRELGAWGALEGDGPTTPAALWVTLATGRTESEHRVSGPIRFDAAASALLVPERAASMVWEIAARAGLPAGVLGWPGSAPIPPGLALRLDDLAFYRGLGLVAELAGDAAPAPPFDPHTDFVGRPPRGGELNARVAAASRERLPALAAQAWPKLAFLAVFLDGLNSARHYAGAAVALGEPAHPPEFGKLSRHYVHDVDTALGQLLALADKRTLVMIVTDDPSYMPGAAPQGQFAHPPHGLVGLLGPEIAGGRRLEKCSALDFAPLALAHLGLPLSQQMPGKPFPAAWASPPPAFAKVASHDAFVRRPYPAEGPWQQPEAARRLAALRQAAHAGEAPFTERNIYALELLTEGKLQGALTEARRDLAERENNAVSQYLLGEIRLIQGKVEEAKRDYAAAAQGWGEPPANESDRALRVAVGLALARAALALNDLPAAADALEPTLAACGGCLEAATLVAQCALRLNRPSDAAAVIAPTLKAHPRDAALWLMLGQARRELGDARGARAAYLAAARCSGAPAPQVLRELGRLEIAEGRWSDALGHLGKLTRSAPGDAEAWFQIALAHGHLGHTRRAEHALEQCLRADPDRLDAWTEWRRLAAADGRDDRAALLAAAARASIANRLVEVGE
jgi:tetratricopeptide (TPR) repeat protein